jgi:hypothetical protein
MCVYRVGGRYGRIRSAGTFPTRQLEAGDDTPVAWEQT